MESPFTFSEGIVRLSVFLGVFSAMALFELVAPRRHLLHGRGPRWLTNFLIIVLDSLIIRVLFPAAAVGIAVWATENNVGLFPWLTAQGFAIPSWLYGLFVFVFMDFAIWAQHLAFHKIPIFWRFHKVHHSDPDIDVTTAIRFHPVEIVLSMLIKAAIIVVLGAPAFAVFLFEVVLNGSAMFNHSNVKLPLWFDALMRKLIVTPDMHRVHHSVRQRETDSNYGFNFSIWDQVFKTYRAQPEDGHEGMTIGLEECQNGEPVRFTWSLWFPFARKS
ncbi:MAG: sterol desaturase family protein [Hyphomicrobiales bacterium]